jgi:cholesterol transport system auxiliary component
MTIDATRRTILAIPVVSALSGCALLSSPKAVPLYRFGQSAGPGASAAQQESATVLYNGTTFPRAAAGGAILTTTGVQVSYIAGSRWAAPAIGLFEEALVRAFQGSAVRLIARGAAARADATLRVEVRTFEARYAAPESPPTVVVETRALLTPFASGATTLDAAFDVERPTAENRVSVIAAAFDAATADVLARLVAWTRANVLAAPAA